MPELMVAYLVGFLLVLVVSTVALWRERAVLTSSEVRLLQRNLAQVQRRFSHSRDGLVLLDEKQPGISQLKTFSLLAVGCAFLSWAGLLFFFLLWISLQKIGQRQRHRLLQSKLAKSQLEAGEVEKILQDLEIDKPL